MSKLIVVSIIALLSISCDRTPDKDSIDQDQDFSLAMAVLYNYYAAEYDALAFQAYNIASLRLIDISESGVNVASLAVVVDIDETVLDNSPYQAKAIVDNFLYPDGWNDWCNEASAKPVPGAFEFLSLADSLGFKIFYISNRKNDFVFDATFNNLISEQFPQVDINSLLLREGKSTENPDPSDKEKRRKTVESDGYEIVLLIGDNLGDFYTDNLTGIERNKRVEEIRREFGGKFIVLPNAMYGNWPDAIGIDGSNEKLRALLQQMSDIY